MNKNQISPRLVLGLLWILFAALLGATAGYWPERVATHFNFEGQPNGWMSRRANLIAYSALAYGLPIAVYGIFCLTRVLPVGLVNLPRREYWLAPERREETLRELQRQSLWLGCLMVLFAAGLYAMTLEANQHDPAQLAPQYVLWHLGGFFAGLVIWVVLLLRRFSKTE